MNAEECKNLIVDQREELREIFDWEKIIERRTPDLSGFLRHPNILVVLGPRRCGKSIFSTLLLKNERYGYMNFDDERLTKLSSEDLNNVLKAFYELYGEDLEFLLLDEIQNVPGWELFANRLRRTKKVIITGSNAKLLSGELATHLTGRHLDFTLYPFSSREFLDFKEVEIGDNDIYSTAKVAEIKRNFEEYLNVGGFPEVQKFGKAILKTIYGDVIQKDILQRCKIRYGDTFKEIAKYLISNFGGEFTYTKLKNISEVKNIHTIKNYVDYLRGSYIIMPIERFSFKQPVALAKCKNKRLKQSRGLSVLA